MCLPSVYLRPSVYLSVAPSVYVCYLALLSLLICLFVCLFMFIMRVFFSSPLLIPPFIYLSTYACIYPSPCVLPLTSLSVSIYLSIYTYQFFNLHVLSYICLSTPPSIHPSILHSITFIMIRSTKDSGKNSLADRAVDGLSRLGIVR